MYVHKASKDIIFSTNLPNFADICTYSGGSGVCVCVGEHLAPHHTNVCKFSWLCRAMSLLVSKKLVSNLAFFPAMLTAYRSLVLVKSLKTTMEGLLARFTHDFEMKMREQYRNNKWTEIEWIDWFIEQIQMQVAFGWLREHSAEKTSYPRTCWKSSNTSLWCHTATWLANQTMPSPY